MRRLAPPLIAAALLILLASTLLIPLVSAQEVPCSNHTIDFDTVDWTIKNSRSTILTASTSSQFWPWEFETDVLNMNESFSGGDAWFDITAAAVASGTGYALPLYVNSISFDYWSSPYHPSDKIRVFISYTDTSQVEIILDNLSVGRYTAANPTPGLAVEGIRFEQSFAGSTRRVSALDNIYLDLADHPCDPDATQLCPAITNANFSAADGWTLSGDANIADGYLNLNPTGQAAQNVTLLPSTDYTAVISVTNAISPATMDVALGDEIQTLDIITAANTYTATFTTPASLAGPLTYELSHTGSGTYAQVSVTYTCLEGATDDGSPECIAPNLSLIHI